MKHVLYFLYFLLAVGCKARTKDTIPLPNQGINILQTADSLLTDDQRVQKRVLKIKIGNLILEKVCIEDNHFVLKATKQDFKDRGIPELYYHSLLKEFEVNNRFIDSMQINQVNELFEQSKQQYRDSLD